MNPAATRRAQREELRAWWAKVDGAKRRLGQMGFSWPGGDVCPASVLRGLAKLMPHINAAARAIDADYDPDMRAAIEWIEVWIDAGRPMLGEGER